MSGNNASVAVYGDETPTGESDVLGDEAERVGVQPPDEAGGGGTARTGGEGTGVQPSRQVEAGANGDELPFTGFAAIPILLGGIALLSAGLVLRRRTAGERSPPLLERNGGAPRGAPSPFDPRGAEAAREVARQLAQRVEPPRVRHGRRGVLPRERLRHREAVGELPVVGVALARLAIARTASSSCPALVSQYATSSNGSARAPRTSRLSSDASMAVRQSPRSNARTARLSDPG